METKEIAEGQGKKSPPYQTLGRVYINGDCPAKA